MIEQPVTIRSARPPILRAACLAVAVSATMACDRGAGDARPADATVVEQYGPYRVGAEDYRVELTMLRRGDDESVLRMRILDGAGAVQIDESFDRPAARNGGLESTVAIVPWVLEGESGSVLMIVREQLPSAPLTGTAVHVFAPRETADGVRLVPLFPPLAPYGEFAALRTDGAGVRQLAPGDELTVDLWRFTHSVRIPLRLDLGCEPGGETCAVVAPSAREPVSGYGMFDVRAEPRPIETAAEVELFEVPAADQPDIVSVRPGSSVEVLGAALDVLISNGAVGGTARETFDIEVRDEWLRVRIDGRDGWITTQQSFEAVGLPVAG